TGWWRPAATAPSSTATPSALAAPTGWRPSRPPSASSWPATPSPSTAAGGGKERGRRRHHLGGGRHLRHPAGRGRGRGAGGAGAGARGGPDPGGGPPPPPPRIG